MPHTTRTLELTETWDIRLTGTGKLALRSGALATAQAVANEARRFVNDTYFDHDAGVPHFAIELGNLLPEAVLRAALRRASLRVDDVAAVTDITVHDYNRETRLLTGSVTFAARSGETLTVAF